MENSMKSISTNNLVIMEDKRASRYHFKNWCVTSLQCIALQGHTQDFSKKVSTRVRIYQYTLERARNDSDYCEVSFLDALFQRN